MPDYASGGLVSRPMGAPDTLHLSREQVLCSDGKLRCVTYWEPLWWPEDGSPHPVHGELHQPDRG